MLGNREQVARRYALDECRDEAVVDENDAVDLLIDVQLGDAVRDRLGVGVRRLVREARPLRLDLVTTETQRRRTLATDDGPDDLVSFGALPPLEVEGAPEHLPVERAREAA